jgi:DNA-binding transcriptional LysR family regulator
MRPRRQRNRNKARPLGDFREVSQPARHSSPDQMRLVSRRLTDFRMYVYASRAYLSAAASIGAREDLKKHPFIGFVEELFAAEDYSDAIGVDIGPRIRSTSILAQLHATSSGSGLCMLPAFVAFSYPMLVPVLSEQVSATLSFHMHIHEDHRRAAPVREVAAFIAAEVERSHSLFHAPTASPDAGCDDMHKTQRL